MQFYSIPLVTNTLIQEISVANDEIDQCWNCGTVTTWFSGETFGCHKGLFDVDQLNSKTLVLHAIIISAGKLCSDIIFLS